MKKALVAVLLAIFFSPCLAQAEAVPQLAAKDFLDLVEAHKGKVQLVNFFATWCPPCRMEVPELVKLREAFPEDKLFMLGLSVDENNDAIAPFIESAGVNYPVYQVGADVAGLFGVDSIPHNVFYSTDGQLIISEPGMANLDIMEEAVTQLLQQAAQGDRPSTNGSGD